MTDSSSGVAKGDGYAVAHLDDLGEGPGFRKIRKELGVTAFGVNAIVLPPSYATGSHYHDEQEELYFVHSGKVAFEFGDGSTQQLGPGGLAWVDAPTERRVTQPQRLRGGGLRGDRREGRLRRARRKTGRGRDSPVTT